MVKKRKARILTLIAFVLIAFLGISYALYGFQKPEPNPKMPQVLTSDKVFSDIKARFGDVRRIKITVPDGAFQIIKLDETWVLKEKNNYPASLEFMKIFANDISNLEKGGLVTNDPALFDKMGVGEPMEFGEGTIVELFDPQDQVISSSHIGKLGDEIYVRRMGDRNIFSAKGKFIEINNLQNWLDLNVINFDPQNIKSISIERNQAPTIDILKTQANSFELDNIKNQKIDDLANLFTRIKFLDIAADKRISSAKIAKYKIQFDNDEIVEFELYQQFKNYWVKINFPENGTQFIKPFAKEWAYMIDKDAAKQILQSKNKLGSEPID